MASIGFIYNAMLNTVLTFFELLYLTVNIYNFSF